MKHSLLIFFLVLLAKSSFAQVKPYQITFDGNSEHSITARSGEADTTLFRLRVTQVVNGLLAEGYLLANVDQLNYLSDTLQALVHIGDKYTWNALGTDNIPEEMLSKAGYRERDFNGENFSSKEFASLINQILNQSANNGYPFATLQLQDIKINQQSVSGVLSYKQGPVIYFDSLTVVPENIVKTKFLENYLRIRKGGLFQIKSINNLSSVMARLPYCELSDSIQMSFQNNLCNIGLELKAIKVNKIDALIGFLPNQAEGNGLLLTGYVNLHLQNLFRSGKELSFIWQQFQQQSQKLFFLYSHPNILNSPLGLKLNFDLLKQDSSFLNTELNIEGYFEYKKIEVSLLTEFKSSRTLSVPADSTKVPNVIDNNIQQLGIRVAYNSIYNPINPRRGSLAFLDFKVGNKVIKPNPNVVSEVYDSINLNPVQMQVIIGGEFNHTIYRPFVLHLDATAGSIINDDQLFTNDLIRLGGVNSLRGFNDLELFVSSYAIVRIEARVIINSGSRLFLFYDQGWTTNTVINYKDTPRGFGAGLKLDTGQGDLQLVYALGVSAQQSLSLTQSKIHIGYVARF